MKKKFTDLVDFVGGKPVSFEGTKSYISTGALKGTTISKEDTELVEFDNRPSRADLEVKKGDILFAKMAFTDKRILIDDDTSNYIYSTGFFAVRAKPNVITTECLYYLLNSKTFKDQKDTNSTGATQKAITNSGLKKIYLKIPNYNNQKEIAEILSNIEKIISFKENQLKEYDQLIKSRFVEMFGDRFLNDYGWNTGELGEFVAFNNGKAHEQVIDKNGKYILVTSRAIASDFVDVRRTNALLFPLYKNDIVMVMSDVPNGQALAKCQLIEENNKYTLNQRICCFNNFSFNSIFLFNLLNRHPYFLSFNDGNSQTNLRKSDILNCDLIVPPIELQNSFAEFAEHIDKLKFVILKCQKHKENLYFVYNNYKYGS